MNDKQLAKLPKYARDAFERLQQQVGELTALVHEQRGHCPDARVLIGWDVSSTHPGSSKPKMGFGERERVEFRLGDSDLQWWANINVRIESRDPRGRCLIISGGDRLHIEPEASNVITVRASGR